MERVLENRLPALTQAGVTRDDVARLAQKTFDQIDAAESTRTDYKYRIGMFLEFLAERPLDANSYLEYKRLLQSRPLMAIATKNKYLAAARVFLKEMNRLGYLPSDITQNVKSFRQDKKHKRDGLTDVEMEKVAEVIQQSGTYREVARIKAMICLLALQGLRQIEVSRLDVEDVNFSRRLVMVHGKGRDDKEPVYLQPETAEALHEYLRLNEMTDGPLFRSESNSSKGQRLSTRSIRQLMREFLADLGIDKTIHGFRHFFTTRLIKAYKGDLLEVSHYTRHRSLEMLQVYNDRIQQEEDLPRFYGAFASLRFR